MNTEWLDRFGGAASALCAVHCLLLGLVPAAVTLFGMNHGTHGILEWFFFGLASASAVVAALVGYRSHHSLWVALSFALGLAALSVGRMSEALSLFDGGGYFAVVGGGTLVLAHMASIRQSRICQRACC